MAGFLRQRSCKNQLGNAGCPARSDRSHRIAKDRFACRFKLKMPYTIAKSTPVVANGRRFGLASRNLVVLALASNAA